tara:strand:+ start:99 stop:377 length:279 start_codon:yes stop_codon:yes gene_type:complete
MKKTTKAAQRPKKKRLKKSFYKVITRHASHLSAKSGISALKGTNKNLNLLKPLRNSKILGDLKPTSHNKEYNYHKAKQKINALERGHKTTTR